MSIFCKYCDNPIYFDEQVLSPNGKKIPLQEWDDQPHNCPLNPYNQFSMSRFKKSLTKVEEDLLLDAAKKYVAFMNSKLVSYSLNLIFSGREVDV